MRTHTSVAIGQRGWKRQPAGGSIGEGTYRGAGAAEGGRRNGYSVNWCPCCVRNLIVLRAMAAGTVPSLRGTDSPPRRRCPSRWHIPEEKKAATQIT
jgi:hypothetical protein